MRQLLIGNKVFKDKCYIDYICYSKPKFRGEEKFFNKIFKEVTEKNYLLINENSLVKNGAYSLNIILKYKNEKKTIKKGRTIKKSNQKNQNQNKKLKEKVNKAIKQEKFPKLSRQNSVLNNFVPLNEKYDIIYVNYNDIKNIPGNFELNDLLEFLEFFKNKGSIIFTNFIKPQEVTPKKGKQQKNDKLKIRINDTKKNEELAMDKDMENLNRLYDLTQLYFFEINDAKKAFNIHYNHFTKENINNRKEIIGKKIFDYFIKGISPATKEILNEIKTGFFLEQFNNCTVVLTYEKKADIQNFDSKIIPKKYYNNIKYIDDYKKLLTENINDYYSILISLIVHSYAYSSPNFQTIPGLYPTFVIGLEIIKKRFELQRNKIKLTEEIYNINSKENELLKMKEEISLKGKEKGFSSNSIIENKSNIQIYHPLYDYNLINLFKTKKFIENLNENGFIDEKYYIMHDPLYRDLMGSITELERKKVSKEKIKQNIIKTIKNINISKKFKDKEINSLQKVKNHNLPIDKL